MTGFVGWVGKVLLFWPAIVRFPGLLERIFPANGSSSAHQHERLFHVHRHGDELQMASCCAQAPDSGHGPCRTSASS